MIYNLTIYNFTIDSINVVDCAILLFLRGKSSNC